MRRHYSLVPFAIVAFVLALASTVRADTGFLDRKIVLAGVAYRYQVYVPEDYSSDRAWPLIIDLHGNGAQGSDGLLQTGRGLVLAEQIRLHRSRFPAIGLFPQAELGKRWLDEDMQALVIAQLDQTFNEFRLDAGRIYLTGFSMGAAGAYRLAFRWPKRFAAVVAIAGPVEPSAATTYSDRDIVADKKANAFVNEKDPFGALATRIKHIPIRIFHGGADAIVPVEQSRRLFEALRRAGADVHYQEYPGASHGGAADNAYADETLITWLFSTRRTP